MRISGEIHNEAFSKFDKLLLIAHYYTLRHACRTVPALSLLGTKLSLALLRYTDIIPADKGKYAIFI